MYVCMLLEEGYLDVVQQESRKFWMTTTVYVYKYNA